MKMTISENTRSTKKKNKQYTKYLLKVKQDYWIFGKNHVGKYFKDNKHGKYNYYLKDRCNGVSMYKNNCYNDLISYKGPTTRAMKEYINKKKYLKEKYNIHI